MACSHDTQTRPEFTYLFLGTPSDKTNTTPVVLRAEANNEQQARSHFPGWNLVFAAQIRTKAPCRLQLMEGGDHFSRIFEQRFDACIWCSGGGACLNSPKRMRLSKLRHLRVRLSS